MDTGRTTLTVTHDRAVDGPNRADLEVPAYLVSDRSLEEVADAVFTATNSPFEMEAGTLQYAIRSAYWKLAQKELYYPSLSVGDVVSLPDRGSVRVEPVGFSSVTA